MIVMNDFKKEYKLLRPKMRKAIDMILASGWYVLGSEVAQFEKHFAEYIGVKYCVGVANGLEALQISLMAHGVGKGDEVLTVSNSAVATALAISNVGATPVFVDIDEYYHMDTTDMEKRITKKTKAIIPVHLFGQMAAIDKIIKIAKKHKLAVVEDACQAHGASYKGKKAGSFGLAGCFSFYPTKNLGGYGDAGAITTNSYALYRKCIMLRNYGQTTRYVHKMKGLNSRLDELQATILDVKLSYLDSFVKKRNKLAAMYIKHLQGIKQIRLPKIRTEHMHAFHLFVLEVENRKGLIKYLEKNKIQSIIHYPIPIHKQECYKEFHVIRLVRTEEKARKILSLPLHPFLTSKEIITVCNRIRRFYAK